mmetsp:Transcript_100558/g.300057  ORF Transcript_100558/g.300057 Transcript_100558/m.300057 type:complete len:86 (+) Transcript_100558:112-369(+)
MGCIVVGAYVPSGSSTDPTDKDWHELSAAQRKAASSLGYTPEAWDDDFHLPIDDLSWRDLTDAQRAALAVLGYSERTWGVGSDSD